MGAPRERRQHVWAFRPVERVGEPRRTPGILTQTTTLNDEQRAATSGRMQRIPLGAVQGTRDGGRSARPDLAKQEEREDGREKNTNGVTK